MKIYFMLAYARDKADAPILQEVMSSLRAEGCEVSASSADAATACPDDLHCEADLYVLKSKAPGWLGVAKVLHERGARILNSYPASVTTLNKVRAVPVLAAAKIPVPRTWISNAATRQPDMTDAIPLIVKPNIGHGGAGIRIVKDTSELDEMETEDGMLVQQLITSVEDELKLYVIGERVFGIRKHHNSGVRETVAVEPFLEDIALRCGRALGLEIYGVDVMISNCEPVVVDVNYFPSFRSVVGAAGALTGHIIDCVKR